MVSRIACVITVLSILFIIPSIVLAIASFIIGAHNTNTHCDDNGQDIIRLSTWLFTNSGVAITSIILYILLTILFFVKEQYKYLVTIVIIYVTNCAFVIIWNIIGAIELFKNASSCQSKASNLWTAVLVSLIFQWVNLSLVFCLVRYDCSNIVDIVEQNDDLNDQVMDTVEIQPFLGDKSEV